jgi:hypothetical protein
MKREEKNMRAFRIITACLLSALLSSCATLDPPALANDPDPRIIQMEGGQVMLEVVGEVINSGAPAPLGSSNQFGYVSFVKGVGGIFSGSPENETTARITFFTEVNTTRVTSHGPFSIVLREGTTTIFLNNSPASFGTPDSFRSGTPIQVSSIRQQVIVDTVEKTFTVVNLNTITSASPFSLDGPMLQIGKPSEVFRTSLQGVLFVRSGGTPPPTGHFAGYAVGVDSKKS